MNGLYPLKFRPLYKSKIWGGAHIGATLNFPQAPQDCCGEIWLLSALEGQESVVANGFLQGNTIDELMEVYMTDLVGERNYLRFKGEFPLLFKILHTSDRLSVQVHPSERGLPEEVPGKTEMWYVLSAEEGAEIFSGFARRCDRSQVLKAVEKGSLVSMLSRFEAKKGEVYFVPSGRVHALGAGLTVAEIQESADTTYRLYDWDRVDASGQARELHLDEALANADYEAFTEAPIVSTQIPNFTNNLVTCPKFQTNEILLTQPISKDLSGVDSFMAYLCVEGLSFIEYQDERYPMGPGELILIPAAIEHIDIYPVGAVRLLETYLN